MRLGELCNLKWSDIDFENKHIILFGKLRTQTSIPMANKLHSELLEYKLVCNKQLKKLSQYVFVTRTGKKLLPANVQNILKD